MCGRGATRLLLVAGLLVCTGLCQNAEPNRRFNDFRNSILAADFDHRRDDFWETHPEGAKATRLEPEELASGEEDSRPSSRGGGNEDEALPPTNYGKSLFELQSQRISNASTRLKPLESLTLSRSDSRQLQNDHRRKKRRRNKQPWKETDEDRDNLVNLGGRNRGKKKQTNDSPSLATASASNKKSRSRAGKFREERRRRRRNRKRTRSRIRLENRREERKWRDNPIVRLIKILNEQKMDEAKLLSDNPLNLSTTRLAPDSETTRVLDISNATSLSSLPSQLTTEPRIPEPPEPTSHYHTQPDDAERKFLEQVKREFLQQVQHGYAREQSAEKSTSDRESSDEDEDEDEKEEIPKFDERYGQLPKQPEDVAGSPFDPERMLGYSRTDEDLPILDMENEVLQRTLKDYNAYMSSSFARAAKISRPQNKLNTERRKFGSGSSSVAPSSSTEAGLSLTNEDNLRGDLSCINGTFVPAPFVQHAVIKYVKSSSPGQEYLEADYECEPGYAMATDNGNGTRLLCHERRWIGRLPVCKYRADDEASCAELNCEQLCRIVAGRAECLCSEGYQLDGRVCIDIDECWANEGRGPCEDTCRNKPGGFECACDGRPGATLAPDNRTCQEPAAEPTEAESCNFNNAGCSHTCLASMGRVFCLCPDGFMLEDDWKTCQDVDECAVPDLQTELCRYGCINTPGSYRCVPPPEQSRPRQDVRNVLQEVLDRRGECQLGYEPSKTKACIDINECSMNNGGCSEVCENTDGSFFCACEGDERILSADKKTCVVAEKRFESMDRASAAAALILRDATCSPLNPTGRGQLICSDNEPSPAPTTEDYEARNEAEELDENEDEDEEPEGLGAEEQREAERRKRPGTKCHLKCPRGYELHGEYELTCRADGTWDGPKHGECLRYNKPRLDCPKDVVAELPPGRDEAFVTYGQPSTDLDWISYVHSEPSWGMRLEANLKKGVHEITFYERHPVSKKEASCTLKITVQEGQAPKVKGCPSDIEITGKNGSAITWVEPVFTDNVKVTQVTSNEKPGRTFSIGGHKVEYEATDEAGWTTKCIFTVVLRPVSD